VSINNFELSFQFENKKIESILAWESLLDHLYLVFTNTIWEIKKIDKINLMYFEQKCDSLLKWENKNIYLNFVTDSEMRKLNNQWRNINKATDCLSFPYGTNHVLEDFWDIFIAFPYIQNQAKDNNVILKLELSKMFVHSLLHLFWYIHDNDKNEKEMKALEKIILNQ